MASLLEFIQKNRFFQSVVLAIFIAGFVSILAVLGAFRKMDFQILDHFFEKRDKKEFDPNISIWQIYDDSVKLSRWPWSWDKYNESFQMMKKYNASVGIMMEDVFNEWGQLTLDPNTAQEKEILLENQIATIKSSEKYQKIKSLSPEYNQEFLETVKEWPHTVLSCKFVIPNDQDPHEMEKEKEIRKKHFNPRKIKAIQNLRKHGLKWEQSPGELLQAIDVSPVIPELSPHLAGVGFSRIIPDDDGTVRQTPTVVYYDGYLWFSQAIATLAHYYKCSPSEIIVIPGQYLRLKNNAFDNGSSIDIPIDQKGMAYINWTTQNQHNLFNTLPFIAVNYFLLSEAAKRQLSQYDASDEDTYGIASNTIFNNLTTLRAKNSDDTTLEFRQYFISWIAKAYIDNDLSLAESCDLINSSPFNVLDLIPAYYSNLLAKTYSENYKGKKIPIKDLTTLIDFEPNLVDLKHYSANYGITEDDLMFLIENELLSPSPLNNDDLDAYLYLVNMGNISEEKLKELLFENELLSKNKIVANDYSEHRKLSGYLTLKDIKNIHNKTLENTYSYIDNLITSNQYNNSEIASYPPLRPIHFRGEKTPLLPNEIIKDKLIFIGLTATGLNALNPTPFAKREPMANLMPTFANTVLTKNFIKRIDGVEVMLIFAGTVLIVCVTILCPFYISAPLFVALLVGNYFGPRFLFTEHGFILPAFSPAIGVILGFVGSLLYQFWEQQKERAKIRGMFAAMVSPEVLKILEEEPDRLSLQGEKVESSMFSSDVSGFTSISEGVTAEELARILNLYLTPMSNLVMIYGGYVEKYEGDAIKADFGMPLPDHDHAWKACFSALLQQEELWVVQRMLELKYGVMIKARMGVNTGTVSAGNMGSENKMQYCALGEAVAMAEELEPSNKMWETWIAIGPETHQQAGDKIVTRLLDRVEFDHEVIPVYEVLGWPRQDFLNFWQGKPIPHLIIEGWERIIPEKILAYIDYYQQIPLPDNPFKELLMLSFQNLQDECIQAVKTRDCVDIFNLDKDYNDIQEKLSAYDREKILEGLSSIDKGDIGRFQKALEASTEDWEKLLAQYQVELRKSYYIVTALMPELERDTFNEYERIVDSLEKKVVCYQKRIGFVKPGDKYGSIFADHLKERLKTPGGGTQESDIEGLLQKEKGYLDKIKLDMNTFIQKAKPLAKEYHEFQADHCLVDDTTIKVIGIFAEGRELYLKQEWGKAKAKFEEGLALRPEDGPCATFIQRCDNYAKNPPGSDWNGDWPADW